MGFCDLACVSVLEFGECTGVRSVPPDGGGARVGPACYTIVYVPIVQSALMRMTRLDAHDSPCCVWHPRRRVGKAVVLKPRGLSEGHPMWRAAIAFGGGRASSLGGGRCWRPIGGVLWGGPTSRPEVARKSGPALTITAHSRARIGVIAVFSARKPATRVRGLDRAAQNRPSRPSSVAPRLVQIRDLGRCVRRPPDQRLQSPCSS